MVAGITVRWKWNIQTNCDIWKQGKGETQK